MKTPADFHTNESYWQEYECPRCGQDLDIYPIPYRGDTIGCGCGTEWPAWEHQPNTYIVDADGCMICVTLPLTSVSSR
ncbi:hypothetical protein LMG32289_03883 [Cupriavidus pampae]|uniref:CPXCG motif-containing cysteine-rich protein n=1 Tax=Cupriavidus pampae TaxID=659251 RepID=A0ABM8XCB1_9BURK|nr:hypothetical protein LMG32289_03883 [Cupriavidus pampae]